MTGIGLWLSSFTRQKTLGLEVEWSTIERWISAHQPTNPVQSIGKSLIPTHTPNIRENDRALRYEVAIVHVVFASCTRESFSMYVTQISSVKIKAYTLGRALATSRPPSLPLRRMATYVCLKLEEGDPIRRQHQFQPAPSGLLRDSTSSQVRTLPSPKQTTRHINYDRHYINLTGAHRIGSTAIHGCSCPFDIILVFRTARTILEFSGNKRFGRRAIGLTNLSETNANVTRG